MSGEKKRAIDLIPAVSGCGIEIEWPGQDEIPLFAIKARGKERVAIMGMGGESTLLHLVCACVIDEDGNRAFEPEDLENMPVDYYSIFERAVIDANPSYIKAQEQQPGED